MYSKKLLALLISSSLLLGCNSSDPEPAEEIVVTPPVVAPDTSAVILTDLDTVYGYASENGGTTGGSGENRVEVTVCTGEQMIAALKDKDPNRPLTIWVNGTITLQNAKDTRIDIKDIKDVSIIGLSSQGEMAGIGFNIVRAENIIIRNLRIHHVRANMNAPGDGISIEGPARNIWIDHNEIYNSLTVDDSSLTLDQVKDYYDGLVDAKGDARYITISFNKFHNSWKTSLVGSSDSDNYERTLTYHHNHWYNVNSRLPLFRFGKGHIYNNFYDGAVESGINSRMGAVIRIEQNHFSNMKNPVMSMYSQQIGYWQLIDNIFENITWEPGAAGSVIADNNQSTGELTVPYNYQPSLIPVHQVKETVLRYAGVGKIDTPPSPGLCPAPLPEEAVPEEPIIDPVPIDPTEPPSSVDWFSYSADLDPFTPGAVTLADGSLSQFAKQQSGGADEPNLFRANGDGTVTFDSTVSGSDRSRAKLDNIMAADGVYPKYFTLLMGLKGNSEGQRIIETEIAFGDTAASTATSRLKVVFRGDGNNSGIQLENASNGSSVTLGKGNEPDAIDMSQYRVYHFAIALSSPTTGNVTVYIDGNNTPLGVLEGVTMRPASNPTDNYLQIGDAGNSSYKADIDWVLWTDAGAYTPDMLKGLLPSGIGNISGYEN
ncbi:pectate lyase family protein [Alishewanella longhuensis]